MHLHKVTMQLRLLVLMVQICSKGAVSRHDHKGQLIADILQLKHMLSPVLMFSLHIPQVLLVIQVPPTFCGLCRDLNEGTYSPAASIYTLPAQKDGASVTFNFGEQKKCLVCLCLLAGWHHVHVTFTALCMMATAVQHL